MGVLVGRTPPNELCEGSLGPALKKLTQEVKREAFQPTDGSRLWGNASALAFGVERIPETVSARGSSAQSIEIVFADGKGRT